MLADHPGRPARPPEPQPCKYLFHNVLKREQNSIKLKLERRWCDSVESSRTDGPGGEIRFGLEPTRCRLCLPSASLALVSVWESDTLFTQSSGFSVKDELEAEGGNFRHAGDVSGSHWLQVSDQGASDPVSDLQILSVNASHYGIIQADNLFRPVSALEGPRDCYEDESVPKIVPVII